MELKRLGSDPSSSLNHNVTAGPVYGPAVTANKPSEGNKAGKRVLIGVTFYIIGTLAFVLYSNWSTDRFIKDVREKRVAVNKEYAAQQARLEAEKKAEREINRRSKELTSFSQQEPARESSTNLFLQSVKAERKAEGINDQVQQDQQILDYGAQVAAYEAQIKAQEEAAAAEAKSRADGQVPAYAVQQYQAGQVEYNPAPTKPVNKTHPSTPKVVQPQQVRTVQAPQPVKQQPVQSSTRINKLETKKIFK